MFLLKIELFMSAKFLVVSSLITGGSVLGLVCLALYYSVLHPREKAPIADEVDSLVKEKKGKESKDMETRSARRERNLQP